MPDLKISQLPLLSLGLQPNAEIPISQSGVTYKVTASGLSALAFGGGGLSTVTTDATLTGDGTISNPLSITNPLPAAGSNGQVLSIVSGNIQWVTPSGGGLSTVTTDATLTGDGTMGNPLSIANPLPAGGSNGQVLTIVAGAPAWSSGSGGYIPLSGTSTPAFITGSLQFQSGFAYSIFQNTGSTTALLGIAPSGAEINCFDTSGAGSYAQARPNNIATLFARGVSVGYVGYTDYGITATATGASTGSVVINVANAGEIQLKDPNRALGKVWTCNNGTTGGGTWQSLPSVSVTTNATLTGSGTIGSPLSVSNPLPAAAGNLFSTLYSDGTSWVPTALFRHNSINFGMGNGAAVSASTLLNIGNAATSNDIAVQIQNTRPAATTDTVALSALCQTNNTAINIGIQSIVANATGQKYALRLDDGVTTGINKVWTCVDAMGDGQWLTAASALTAGSPPNITGSRSSNAALANLLTELALLGILTDSTT